LLQLNHPHDGETQISTFLLCTLPHRSYGSYDLYCLCLYPPVAF
jgi:hypothetical protein